MPAMFADALKQGDSMAAEPATCSDCRQTVPREARFCPHCGHHLVVFLQCPHCGKNLPPHAKFCSRCGQPVQQGKLAVKCSHCGAENLPQATYCNQCGEKL